MYLERGWIVDRRGRRGGSWLNPNWPAPPPASTAVTGAPAVRLENLQCAIEIQGLIEDAGRVEASNPSQAASLYERARSLEVARRDRARGAGIFSDHEIETGELFEIERGLRKVRSRLHLREP